MKDARLGEGGGPTPRSREMAEGRKIFATKLVTHYP